MSKKWCRLGGGGGDDICLIHGAALILYIAGNRISLYLRIAAECWIVYRLIFPLIDTDSWYFVNFWNIDIRLSEFYWI